jgi:hypothetical protein
MMTAGKGYRKCLGFVPQGRFVGSHQRDGNGRQSKLETGLPHNIKNMNEKSLAHPSWLTDSVRNPNSTVISNLQPNLECFLEEIQHRGADITMH